MEKLEKLGPICLIHREQNTFWKDTFQAYKIFFNKVYPTNPLEMLSEPLFFNDKINMNSALLRQREWIDKNACCIADLCKEDGYFLTYVEFMNKYDIRTNFLSYAVVIKKVKDFVKSFNIELQNNVKSNSPIALSILHSVKKGTRPIYDIFVEEGTTPKCCQKWNDKLNTEINWYKTFKMMQSIPEIKLKWFQVRVIHRILPTNVVLSCMGVKSDNRCSFCLQEKDSIEHMLWRCAHVNAFWTQLQQLDRKSVV